MRILARRRRRRRLGRRRASRPAATSSSAASSPTTTSAGRSGPSRRRPTPASSRPRSTPRSAAAVAALCREHEITHVLNAVDPRFVMPIFDGAFAAGRRLPRHGDVAVPARTRTARTRSPGSSSATSSSPRPTQWEAAGRLALVGMGVEPGTVRRVRPLRRRPPLRRDRRDRRPRRRRTSVVDGYDFAPSFSIWTTIEECLNPPVIWEAEPRLVHHRAVLRAGGVRLPGGHRPGRVRERGARGGAADPALGRRRSGSPSSTGWATSSSRCCKTLHKLGLDRTEPVRVGGVEVSPRDVVAACLPDPAALGDRMHGKTCAGTWVTRHRHGRRARARSTSTTWSTTSGRWPSTARRPWSGRPRSTRSSRWSCSPPGAWSGAGVLGPEAFDAGAVPRPADRVRLAVGHAGAVTVA